jgi:FtsP/CotA-like multicopper oxidase with cupredoxin domain
MKSIPRVLSLLPVFGLMLVALPAGAQSFKVQCPTQTSLHPLVNAQGQTGQPNSTLPNPHIKCQQISGGDGFATMGDGTQTYMFSFGPLSGLADIVKGLPGTAAASVFNQNNLDASGNALDVIKIGAPYPDYNVGGDPLRPFNGAIGLVPDVEAQNGNIPVQPASSPLSPAAWAAQHSLLTGHVDPRLVMDVGVLNGNIPAPMIAIDEGDELFLTLTNVGMVMRPDLFEQHTVHFHGYPNASAYYDGVPDASIAINIGGSFTYYYLAPEAGTYMWHCHISPPEHLQMGMVGQLYVRPRQDAVPAGSSLYSQLTADQLDVFKKCDPTDLLCSVQLPPANSVARVASQQYAYDDGDGSTAFDVEYPIQMHGFDPNFHFVGMTFNPESFADNKDKFFLLNGRSYPDTINPAPLSTQASDGTPHFSQPLNTVINIPVNGKALLRFSDLNVTEFHTLASLGIKMHVVGLNARLLRDQDGKNMDYYTNSITLGGGETIDVILDATGKTAGQKFYLYTPQLDHLSNDAENFGGMMTEVNICTSVDVTTKQCSI